MRKLTLTLLSSLILSLLSIESSLASPAPTITSISPDSGLTMGGTSVVITGTNFVDIQSVLFDGYVAVYTVDSPTQITAISPAHSQGIVTISVNNSGGSAPTNFTYTDTFECSLGGTFFVSGNTLSTSSNCAGNANIPYGVTYIGNAAFYNQTQLVSVTIPNTVTDIGNMAFSGADSLTVLVIPNSVTNIVTNAFDGATSLSSVTLGNSVSSIQSEAFKNTTSLTSIKIPNSVSFIGQGAFSDSSLSTVTFRRNSAPTIQAGAFPSGVARPLFYVYRDYFYTYIDTLGAPIQDALPSPINVSVKPFGNNGDTLRATMTINSPAGEPISFIQYSQDGGPFTNAPSFIQAGSQFTIDITGLQPDQTYSFEFRAGNEYGFGNYSQALEARPGVPDQATLNSMSAGNHVLNLNYGIVGSRAGKTNSYEYSLNGNDESWVPMSHTGLWSYSSSISGLENGTLYSVRVRARNDYGPGSASNSLSGTPALSSVDTLSALSLSSGTLTPSFSPTTYSYSASVGNSTSSITVTPTFTGPGETATVMSVVTASGSASSPISLNVGSNTITIITTAENGSQKTYTITVTRAAGGGGTPEPVPVIPTYRITYSGNASDVVTVPVDFSPYLSGQKIVVTSQAPIRTGFSFVEWNTSSSGGGTAYKAGATITVGTSNITLYAIWKINQYTINFDSNGGPTLNLSQITQDYNSIITVPALPQNGLRIGYTFLGWNIKADGSGSPYAPSEKLQIGAANITLFVQWKINQYTVIYQANGNENGRVPASVTQDFNSKVTVSAPSQVFTRKGYTFSGWSMTIDGSGTSFKVGDSFTLGASNQTLYAIWAPNTYLVTFLNTSKDPLPKGQFVSGGVIASAPTPPSRKGFLFMGWSSKADKSNIVAFPYAPGVIRNVTLYAVWAKSN